MSHRQNFILITLILILSASLAAAQETQNSGVELKAREQWSTVFGGRRVTLHFDFTPAEAAGHSAQWSYTAGHRRLAAGELTVKDRANGGKTVELPLRIPPVNDGVIFATMLNVSLVKDGEVVASINKPITIYSERPFTNKKTWLEELSISLYDPDGRTAERFEAAEIPFHRLGTLASIGNVDDGIVVVGEAHSLKVERGLFDVLTEVAARGVPVLCLASTGGEFPLPFSAETDLPQPDRVLLDRNSVITRFDKRLDANAWGMQGDPVIATLQVTRSRTGIDAKITDDTGGWPWLELEYGERGNLIWCGFGLIERWEESPTPRYLLAHIFEHIADTKHESVSDDKPRSLP